MLITLHWSSFNRTYHTFTSSNAKSLPKAANSININISSTMTTTAPSESIQQPLSDDYDERSAQVAALVAARKAKLVLDQKKAEKAEQVKMYSLLFGEGEEEEELTYEETQKKEDFKQTRVKGAKGKEGSSDHTRGKSAFKRPCTVGWKSQNQPLSKGGGNRTPL
jgi:hypothetical protein